MFETTNQIYWAGEIAANYTNANWAATAELSPPEPGSPQDTTDPSARIAANAR